MAGEQRSLQIQQLLREKFVLFRWGRCARRCGFVLATLSYAVFEFYTAVPPKFVEHWPVLNVLYLPSSQWVKTAALGMALAGAALFLGGYAVSYASAVLTKTRDALWAKYLHLRRIESVDAPRDALVALVFSLGDAQNPGSFIRRETLRWLYDINTDFVQAWGTRCGNPAKKFAYTGVCFFVVAPLTRQGVTAMQSRAIRKNKDLRVEHVASSFRTARGVYVIEVFGATFFQKGAILYLLQRCLDRSLKKKLASQRFALFTRPVNVYGYRQVRRFGFENLGDSIYEMHSWHAAPGRALRLRRGKSGLICAIALTESPGRSRPFRQKPTVRAVCGYRCSCLRRPAPLDTQGRPGERGGNSHAFTGQRGKACPPQTIRSAVESSHRQQSSASSIHHAAFAIRVPPAYARVQANPPDPSGHDG